MYSITPQDVYRATNGGLDVILSYYPQAEPATRNRRHKFSVRDEKTPSCVLTEYDGVWYVKDFGSSDRAMSAVDVAMREERVDFPRALQLIAENFRIEIDDKKYKPASAEYKRRDATPEEKIGDCTWVVKDWEIWELKVLFAQNVWRYLCQQGAGGKKEDADDASGMREALKVVKRYNLHSLQSYSLVGKDKDKPDKIVCHTFTATPEYPIFMFDEGDWQKFYQPRNRDKAHRFFSTGRKPDKYVFGQFQLNKAFEDLKPDAAEEDPEDEEAKPPKKLPEVIICTGGSDALNVAALGYHVVWQNSETALLSADQYKRLSDKVERVYNLPDIDDTGRKEAMRLALEYLDLHTIYLPESLRDKRDLRGNSCKDVRDYFRFYGRRDFERLLVLAYPLRFWDASVKRNKKGKIVISAGKWLYDYKPNNELIYNFLARMGFGIMEMPSEKTGEQLVHVDGHVVKKIDYQVINRYVKEFIRDRALGIDLLNAFHRSPNFSESSLKNLNLISLPFEDTGRDYQYLFFKNAIWKITPGGIEESRPADCDRYVWYEEVIKQEVRRQEANFRIYENPTTGKWDITIYNTDCLFLRYLIQVSRIYWRKELEDELDKKPVEFRKEYREQYQYAIDGPLLTDEEIQEQKQHLISKLLAYGYYLHRYKSSSRPLCVWAMDYVVENTEESHGGTGKSIFFWTLTQLMKNHFLNGRDKRLTLNPHFMEGTDEHTDLVWLDDADKYLDLGAFYPMITQHMTVNPKGKQSYTIDFEQSPKLGVTSNFPPSKNDKTTRRRLWFTAFSDYYHSNPTGEYREERKPSTDLGKELLKDEFSADDWNNFLNTAAICCQSYMLHGPVEPPMESIMTNLYRNNMGETFHAWADVYFSEENDRLDKMVPRYMAFETYKREGQGQISPQGFLEKLKNWCYFHGYTFNPPEALSTKEGRIVQWMEKMVYQAGEWRESGKKESVECIYIQTDPEKPITKELPKMKDMPF